jgi:signal transduction histidine kinase
MPRLHTRIYFGFGMLSLLLLGMAVLGSYGLSVVGGQVGRLNSIASAELGITRTNHLLETVRRAQNRYLRDPSPDAMKEMTDATAEADVLLTHAINAAAQHDRQADYLAIRDVLRARVATQARFAQLRRQALAERIRLFDSGDQLTAVVYRLFDAVSGTRDLAELDAAARSRAAILLMQVHNERFLATLAPDAMAVFGTGLTQARVELSALDHIATPDTRIMIKPVEAALDAYEAEFTTTSNDFLESTRIFDQELLPRIIAMQRQSSTIAESLKQNFAEVTRDAQRTVTATSLEHNMIGMAGLTAGLLLAFLIARSIVRPLAGITDAMMRLAAGDRTVTVPARTNTDEVGDMARAVEVFKQAAIERDLLEQEREQQRHELARSNADLEKFAYVASHDLKAPLRAIAHLAQWIAADIQATANPETIDNLYLLQGRAERLQALLDGLLTYSRAGQGHAVAEDLDIAAMVNDIAAKLAPQPGFIVACEGTMPKLRTYRRPIRVVLENLIGNGLMHHDRAEGRISVAMQRVDGVAEFRVSDDGPGIPKQFHNRIFAIFQTLASRDDVESSGIGLAIVNKEVQARGGRISVESAPPQRGTTFVFTWPEAATQEAGRREGAGTLTAPVAQPS